MGFDNECILSIQSLPGEYFCPVCRTLIYPNEALQTQCTHLYCKPCLAYVVATTKACPYDGYLVTETDSKPLMESNKSLADTIGKVTVHCLYNKSGCPWQGTLSACITHGTSCAYGNSPVVCNRCGIQIVHRQVQEHAQLCPGLQSQTQQADGNLVQPSAGTTQAVAQDSSLASVGSAPAPATTLPSATTATAVAASATATGGSAGATTASTVAVPPSFAAPSATAPQTPTTEQWYQQQQQQMQYSQYYQQQYPGYNPYMQQYQQYGQYQQVYQPYTQPQMQVPSQNMPQGSAQPASYVQNQVQSSQPQYVMQSQSQLQLPPLAGHPQPHQHPVQPHPQSQPHLPHLQAPASQSQPQQPIQSASQVPQLQPQGQVPLQLSGPQFQPTAHPPAPSQVGNQQFATTSAQAAPLQAQPLAQAPPAQQQQIVAQQQHAHMQALPPQQNLQPQMQLNSQVQLQPPQVQQQSYPQPQVYAQQTHHMQPQNASYPQQQTQHSAPLQHPVSQHPAPMRPPMPGQQPAMLPPQGIQHLTQHIGYQGQRPPIHPTVSSQAPLQGLPPHSSVSSQAGISPSPSQSHVQPNTQHVTGYNYAGQHVQTKGGMPTSYLAPPQQFQHQPGVPVNSFQASVINQQPATIRASDNAGLTSQSPAAGQPTGQGSLALETHASKSWRPENASNAAVSENSKNGTGSSVMRPTMSQPLGDENMNREHNDFGGRKDTAQTGVASQSTDGSVGHDGIVDQAGNSHGPLQGGKEHKDAPANRDKGGSLQPSCVPQGTGPQHPSGLDSFLPQHMMHPGQKHSFSENIQPPMLQPRVFGENQIQMPMSQTGGIRPGDGMIRPPMAGPLTGRHDTMVPPFVPEHLGRPHPLGASKNNGFGGGALASGRAFSDEGFNTSGEHLRSLAAYPGRHNNIEDDLKQFPGPSYLDAPGLQMGSGPFERALGRPDGFSDSLPGRPPFPNQKSLFPVGLHQDFSRKPNAIAGHPDFLSHGAEFDHHKPDAMPNFRNTGPFGQGVSGGPAGTRKDQFGSGSIPGNVHHSFDGPAFPPTHFHPGARKSLGVHAALSKEKRTGRGREEKDQGEFAIPAGSGHMHPGDPNLAADFSRHGLPKEPVHFGLGGPLRNGDVGWCRICMFNCGSAENLDLHVHTREHQQFAMDIVLKMKQDVAMRQKLNHGGSKLFHNKKVAGKGHFRGNRR
ncbi:hypothetical protein U9M48_017128 [Paspalum notatum var. saurae]|uniref:RING-type domain-containing protein n=1 Tax=Paspalum notatum var. saurae TaxID=547442 RepID=A0AAQ3T940_PASNO